MALLPAVFGMNLWLVTLVVPVLLSRGDASLWALLCLPLCPALLFVALHRPRHGLSPFALLLGVPLLCLLPGAEGAVGDTSLHPRAAVLVQAAVLLSYLAAASRELSGLLPGPALQIAPLHSQEVPQRWRRRIWVYRTLWFFSMAVPALLLYAIDLYPANLRALRLSFEQPGRLGAVQATFTAAAALCWIATFQLCLVRPLRSHLEHDREVTQDLVALQRLARRGRPRPQFYLAMLLALGSMILLILRSLRS